LAKHKRGDGKRTSEEEEEEAPPPRLTSRRSSSPLMRQVKFARALPLCLRCLVCARSPTVRCNSATAAKE
jgi:hypothetical protein